MQKALAPSGWAVGKVLVWVAVLGSHPAWAQQSVMQARGVAQVGQAPQQERLLSLPQVQVTAWPQLETGSVVQLHRDGSGQGGTLADVVRYQPLAELPNALAGAGRGHSRYDRGGSAGYNIRGLEGNRVGLDVDGVEMPEAVEHSGWSGSRAKGTFSMGRDFMDPELYSSVNIQAGAAGGQRGGIGGAVSFQAKSPEDYLRHGQKRYADVKTGYAGSSDTWTGSATGAVRMGDFSGLLAYSRRHGHPDKNHDSQALRSEPQSYRSNALLLKGQWQGGPQHKLVLSGDFYRRSNQAQSTQWNNDATKITGHSTQQAETERDTLQLTHHWTPAAGGWADYVQTRLYHQRTLMDDATHTVAPAGLGVWETSRNSNRLIGFASKMEKELGRHRWSLGVSASRNANEHAMVSSQPFSNRNPSAMQRPYPDNTTTRWSAYVEDAIGLHLGERRLVITPSLRVDGVKSQIHNLHNMVSPSLRQAEIEGIYGSTPGNTIVSPGLSLAYYLQPQLVAYAQLKRSGRAPTSSERYGMWRSGIDLCRCIMVGDPKLKAETSQALDLGLKGEPTEGVNLHGALFYTQYKNFIGFTRYERATHPQMFIGTPDRLNAIFRSENRDRAHIYGLELSTRLDWGTWVPAAKGLYSHLALGYSQGKAKSSYAGDKYVALDTIQPAKAIAALGYDAPNKRWGLNLTGTFVRGKRAVATNRDNYRNKGAALEDAKTELLRVPGFARFDLGAYWQLNRHMRLEAGIQNLGGKRYWNYSNVRHLRADSALDQRQWQLSSQPGRSYSLYLTAAF